MVIKWQLHDEHTDFGLFKVGDVIETTEKRIPPEVVAIWIRAGFAVAVKERKPAAKKGKEE